MKNNPIDDLRHLKVIIPDEPYGDLEIFSDVKHRAVCKLWQDDAPCADFNADQYRFAKLFAASPRLYKACLNALCLIETHHLHSVLGFDAKHCELALKAALRDAAD